MKPVLFLFLLPVLGCATAQTEDVDLLGSPQIRTVMAGMADGGDQGLGSATIRYVEAPILIEEVMTAPADEVLPLLLRAYVDQNLVPDGVDSESGIVSLSRVEWSGERNGQPLSAILDCGLSSTGRPLANGSRVVGSITSQVAAEGTADSRVRIRFEAVAYPPDASGGSRRCTTLGELERDLIGHIRAAMDQDRVLSGIQGTAIGPRLDPPIPAVRVPTDAPSPTEARDLGLETGDKIRVWLSPSMPISGSFMGIRADTLLLRRSRRTALPLWSIEGLQVKRHRGSVTMISSIIGAAAGVTAALTTGMGISGNHSVQGDLLNPGLGAMVGGLAGAAIGTIFFGTSWEDIPMELVHPDSYMPGLKPIGTGGSES